MHYKQIYIAVDLHHKNSVIGYMDQQGQYIEQLQIPTTAKRLRGEVAGISADCKYLTIEQGNQAFWAGQQLAPYVDRLIICDPKYNRLITHSEDKNDAVDTRRLCTLLRLGSLKEVWRPKQMGHRRLFYQQIKEYEWLNKQLVINKRRLQATLQHWGYRLEISKTDYKYPERICQQVGDPKLAGHLRHRLAHIGFLTQQKTDQLDRIVQAGSQYEEISEFQKMPGMGKVRSHTFSGYIQTPHRFANRRQVISFSKLAVVSRSSDGRRLAGEHLSKAGHSSLKNLSYGAWKTAMNGDNEVSRFYQASLERCGDPIHARLNTQRKILISLWSLWKNNQSYRPEKFGAANGASPQ